MSQGIYLYIFLKQVFRKGYNFPANTQLAVNLQTFRLLPFFFQLLGIRKLHPIGRGFWEALKIELVNLDGHAVAKGKERGKKMDFYCNSCTDVTAAENADHCETKYRNTGVFVSPASALCADGPYAV